MRAAALLILLLLPLPSLASRQDSALAKRRYSERIARKLEALGAGPASPLYIRAFKTMTPSGFPPRPALFKGRSVENHQEAQLEIWVRAADGRYVLYDSFPVCSFSGKLGPKIKEGDRQSPEGFYELRLERLMPETSYHLAMDIGYPNAFDRSLKRTGGNILIHGDCYSVGCLAMGRIDSGNNGNIDEIYVLAENALRHGQKSIPVHLFPFPLTEGNLAAMQNDENIGFWSMLEPAYRIFESERRVPQVRAENGVYLIQ